MDSKISDSLEGPLGAPRREPELRRTDQLDELEEIRHRLEKMVDRLEFSEQGEAEILRALARNVSDESRALRVTRWLATLILTASVGVTIIGGWVTHESNWWLFVGLGAGLTATVGAIAKTFLDSRVKETLNESREVIRRIDRVQTQHP